MPWREEILVNSEERIERKWLAALSRVVPREYLADRELRSRLGRILSWSLAIRFVLMPFFCHGDLVSSYHRSYRLLSDFRAASLLPHELVQAAFLQLYSLFLPLQELLAWPESQTGTITEFWLNLFVRHPQAVPALFLFKLPYLIFDLLCALVLLRLFAKTPAKGLRAFSLWLLNPITIFTFYVFGRHDVVSIFFVLLGLQLFETRKTLRGALSLGVAVWSRIYPLLLLPFLVALHGASRAKKAVMVLVAVAPLALHKGLVLLTSSGEKVPLLSPGHSRFVEYGIVLKTYWIQQVLLFPLLYGLLFFIVIFVLRKSDRLIIDLSACCASVLLLFYATTYFHPQYFSWIIPFLVILRADSNQKELRLLHHIQIFLFVPYTFYFGHNLFGHLAAALGPDFFISLPSPWELLDQHIPAAMVLNASRSLLSATCLFMVFWLLFRRPESSRA